MSPIHFTVSGRGEFPLDMLRRDGAEFASAEDRAVALERAHQRRSVALICHDAEARYFRPTVGRWESFGWSVVAADSGRVSRHAAAEVVARTAGLTGTREPHRAPAGPGETVGADRFAAAIALLKELRAVTASTLSGPLLARVDGFIADGTPAAESPLECA